MTIGIDPHKQTHSGVAVDGLGGQLAQRTVSARTSTAICSIAYAAIAAAANIPGGQILLVAMIIFHVIATIVTTRNPTGDYCKALRALRS